MLPARTATLIAIVIGIGLEIGVTSVTGRREAWDAGLYWTIGLPIAAAGAAAIGYAAIGRGWLSTVLIVPAQVATMTLRNGEIGALWPLTIALSGILSLPFVAVAWIARRLRT